MKRSNFLLLSALISWVIGLAMITMPDKMLANLTGVAESSTAEKLILQWVGVGIISVGLMNFVCRNAHGSKSLRAILAGNVVMHILGLVFDIYDYSIDFLSIKAMITSTVIHILLLGGFVYYLLNMKESSLMGASRSAG